MPRLCDITVKEVHRTAKAILVSDGDREVWIPLSICEIVKLKDQVIEVTLPEHWAQEHDLI